MSAASAGSSAVASISSPSQWNQTGTTCGRPSDWTELSQTTGSSRSAASTEGRHRG